MYQWHEESLLYEWEVQSENLLDTIGDSLSLIDFQSDIIQLDGNDSVISETEINNDKSIKGQGKFRIIGSIGMRSWCFILLYILQMLMKLLQ